MSASASEITPLLRAEGVHAYYGQSHILRGVSFHVQPGESLALMGRNGMGKTTLLRALMGLMPCRSGRIWVDGAEMTGKPAFVRAQRGLAYVPEGRGIFATLTVAEHLLVAERPGDGGRCEWTRARVLELFPRLAQRLDNGGNQLSGGEQQMLAIARALLTNPRLLILDEATEGLAPIIRDEIWRTIRRVRDTGIATLIVDKSVTEVAAIADRIVVLVKGEIAFDASPGELQANPELMHRHLGV